MRFTRLRPLSVRHGCEAAEVSVYNDRRLKIVFHRRPLPVSKVKSNVVCVRCRVLKNLPQRFHDLGPS